MSTMTFETWMAAVDKIISDRFMGLTSDDLPDYNYSDMHSDGATPKEAAEEAIENADN